MYFRATELHFDILYVMVETISLKHNNCKQPPTPPPPFLVSDLH